MNLVPFWFIVIAILWIGFFVLEGLISALACCTKWSVPTRPVAGP